MRSVFSPGISGQRRIAILAPRHDEIPVSFHEVDVDHSRYQSLLWGMQRLRGRVYMADGALEAAQLTSDGRHVLSTDEQGWHLLMLGGDDEVLGCMRYLRHSSTIPFSRLGVARSALAQCKEWGERLKAAVRDEIIRAETDGIGFGEAGGWALHEDLRGSTAALSLVLGIFGLAQLLGDAHVLSTATMRNGSAKILQRLGGAVLAHRTEQLPVYYDPAYRCEMQVLRFDSRRPNPRYDEGVQQVRYQLLSSSVVRSSTLTERLLHMGAPLPAPHMAFEASA